MCCFLEPQEMTVGRGLLVFSFFFESMDALSPDFATIPQNQLLEMEIRLLNISLNVHVYSFQQIGYDLRWGGVGDRWWRKKGEEKKDE